MTVHRLM